MSDIYTDGANMHSAETVTDVANMPVAEIPASDVEVIDPAICDIPKRRGFLYGKKYLCLCFFVPAVLMLLIYVALGVWPVSDNSALVLDLNAQYIYYLEKFRSILCEGGSFLYSFERALGGEFMGIFAYYLASPFNLIFALFPKENITEALLLVLVLKCGASGLTFGIFMNASHDRRRVAADVIFSSMYALSAFAVVMQHNLMWTDNLICLPLIMLGIDRIIKYGKFKTYTIFLALAVFTNFYIGYMTCIFIAIYFFVRYFSMTKSERNPRGVKVNFLRSFGKIVLFSAIGVGMAALVIFTAYYSLSFGKLEFSEPDFTPSQLFDISDMLSKIFFGSYDTVRPEGMPFLYAGMLMPILVPLYFITPGIPPRRKIGAGFLTALFFVSFNLSTADLVWHGFQRPNWLNARFTFIFVMILLMMSYEVFIRLSEFSYGRIAASGFALIALLVFLQKSELENLPDFKAVWVSIGIIGLYLAILRLTGRKAADIGISLASVMLVITVSVELFAAGVVNLYDLDADVVYSTRASYRDFIDPYVSATELVDDDGFYRSEKLSHRKTNDNFAIGLRGISNSTSTLNSSVIDFLQKLGFTSRSHWSKYVGGNAVSDTLLGIKYLYIDTEEDDVPWYVDKYYEKVGESEDGIAVYRNPYAMSVAFTMPSGFDGTAITGDDYENPFELMNDIVEENSGVAELWEKSPLDGISFSGCRQFGVQDNHSGYEKNDSSSSATVTLTTTAKTDGTMYMYISTKWNRKANFRVNGKNFGNYFTNDTQGIVELGSFKAGEQVVVEMTLSEEKLYMQNGGDYFYTFNEEAFTRAFAGDGAGMLDITSHSEDRISGTVTVANGNTTLLTTIPYDEGWQITCDGEKIAPRRALGALMAIDLEEGEHVIEFRYMSDAFRYGAIISISSCALFVFLCVISYMLKRRKERRAVQDMPKLRSAKRTGGYFVGKLKHKAKRIIFGRRAKSRRRSKRSINDLHIKRTNNRS